MFHFQHDIHLYNENIALNNLHSNNYCHILNNSHLLSIFDNALYLYYKVFHNLAHNIHLLHNYHHLNMFHFQHNIHLCNENIALNNLHSKNNYHIQNNFHLLNIFDNGPYLYYKVSHNLAHNIHLLHNYHHLSIFHFLDHIHLCNENTALNNLHSNNYCHIQNNYHLYYIFYNGPYLYYKVFHNLAHIILYLYNLWSMLHLFDCNRLHNYYMFLCIGHPKYFHLYNLYKIQYLVDKVN